MNIVLVTYVIEITLGRFDEHVMADYNNEILYNQYKNIVQTIYFPKNKPMAYSNINPIHSKKIIELLNKYKHVKVMGSPIQLEGFPLKKSKMYRIKPNASLPNKISSVYVFDEKIVKQIAKKYKTNYKMLLKSMLYRTIQYNEHENIIHELMGNNKKSKLNKFKENTLTFINRNTK